MQCSVRADRHVGADHIVVDGTNQSDDVKALMRFRLFGADLAFIDQLTEVLGPFRAEFFGSRQRSIAANDDEAVDPLLNQVQCRCVTSFILAKFWTTSGTDDRSALRKDSRGIGPGHGANAIATFHCARPTVEDRKGASASGKRGADDCANRGIHSLRIPARGEDTDLYRF